MRVETNKTENQAVNERQTRVSPKHEPSSNFGLENYINSNANQNKKDFASILENSERQSETRTEDKKPDNSTDKKSVSEQEKESKSETKDSKEVKQEKREQYSDGGESDGDQEKSFGSIQINSTQNSNEISIPACRQILHVADLERIIAKIRAQNVLGGKQVLIELKRSVFEGLQIKLTVGKDKSVVAEFIAANEAIKNQINARAEELAMLLKDRGVKLARMETSLSSDQEQNRDQNKESDGAVASIDNTSKANKTTQENEHFSNDSDTSYHI